MEKFRLMVSTIFLIQTKKLPKYFSCPQKTSGDVVIPKTVKYENVEYIVKQIGRNAFARCNSITSIRIPDEITAIEESAFYGCSGLTSIVIPNSVAYIGSYAFSDCSGLNSVTISNSVISIGGSAFSGCDNLQKVIVKSIATWCKINFESNPLQIAHHLYSDEDTEIIDLVIPEGVTEISRSAFRGCENIKTLHLPNSVKNIGGSAFEGCTKLEYVNLPEGVTEIGGAAFSGCESIKSVRMPKSMEKIGYYAFAGCNSLESIHITDLAAWCKVNFYNFDFEPDFKLLMTYDNIILNGQEIKDLVIPDGVTAIGWGAFSGCQGITSATIPNTVTGIGNSAFYRCNNLIKITIPNSVTEIDYWAFYCENLQTIISELTKPFDMEINYAKPFSSNTIKNATLYVPIGTRELYTRLDGWRSIYQIKEYRPGAFDRSYDVGDVSKVVNFIMNSNASEEDLTKYDLNADGELSIGDIILIVRWILENTDNSAIPARSRNSVDVDLSNFSAAQFEVKVPNGTQIRDIHLVNSMKESHEVMYKQIDEQTLAVVVYSPTNQLIEGDNIIAIDADCIDGNDMMISNVTLAKPNGETIHFAELSGLTNIKQSIFNDKASNTIYDLQGNRLDNHKIQKQGIYIVNGKKIVVR